MKKFLLVLTGVVIGSILTFGVASADSTVSPAQIADLVTKVTATINTWAAGLSTVTPPVTATKPSDITGALWTVTGPFNKPGQSNDPQNEYVTVAQVDTSFAPYMFMNGSAVVFKTPVTGVTTSNSSYPRTELREMKDTNWTDASWSDKTGTNTLNVTESIDHEPVVKPEVVAAQIHDSSDDVIQIFLQGNKLYTRYNDDNSLALMDSNYMLGTPYNLQITATGGVINVSYNGVNKLSWKKSESGLYFKAGSYCQSNVAHGDSASAYCQVSIDSISVVH